jgi:branched-chain amino acid transport system permease protein
MKGLLRSCAVSLWFIFLTFPIIGIRISPVDGSIIWRLDNVLFLAVGTFVLSFAWRIMLVLKGKSTPEEADLVGFFNALRSDVARNRLKGVSALVFGLLPLALVLPGLADEVHLASLTVSILLALMGSYAALAYLSGRPEKVSSKTNALKVLFGSEGRFRAVPVAAVLLLLLPLPWIFDIYRINVMASTFIWVMLGLGLNIVVGQAGLLVLGYVAFYAVGAYIYAVGNAFFGNDFIGFWIFLPLGGLGAALAGILLSLPVLRLRGDYLAIVTLGFGEIVRVTLEGGGVSLAPLAWVISFFTDAALPAWFTTPINLGGPAGIGNIPYPSFFGLKLSMDDSIRFVYYIALFMAIFAIIAVSRLRDSRLGRSWTALREDEVACEAMGINKVAVKLSAFALGACWAGFGGVLFAAKTTFINPSSFTFMESALILSVIVLGGLGSILGAILGACVLILLPEYLRSFNEYRMLIFGASMVLMMVFRPQGLITPKNKKRKPTHSHAKALANTEGV